MDRVLPRAITSPSVSDTLAKLLRLLRLCRQRSRTRRQLAALDDRLLADAGISHGERIEELNKPFWR